MKWGQRLNQLITRNWREKIISLLLAFLFWFMIKAQDARQMQPAYAMPPAPVIPQSTPAPSQLSPSLPATAPISPDLAPVVPPPVPVVPLPGAGAEPGASLLQAPLPGTRATDL